MDVVGLGGVLARMGALTEAIGAVVEREGLPAAGEAVRERWQQNIESEGFVEYTGHYHDSITVTEAEGKVAVVSDADYASILEYGDSRQAAHPVAERAADESHDDVTKAVGDALGKLLR